MQASPTSCPTGLPRSSRASSIRRLRCRGVGAQSGAGVTAVKKPSLEVPLLRGGTVAASLGRHPHSVLLLEISAGATRARLRVGGARPCVEAQAYRWPHGPPSAVRQTMPHAVDVLAPGGCRLRGRAHPDLSSPAEQLFLSCHGSGDAARAEARDGSRGCLTGNERVWPSCAGGIGSA